MTIEQLGLGTSITRNHYHDTIKARVLCSDGKLRNTKRLGYPDTFFSQPASVSVKGKTVSGYITFDTRDGFSTPTEEDPRVVRFRAYNYGKNSDYLPN